MEVLSVYDPDEDFFRKEKKEVVELVEGSKCPTCKQKIEKKIENKDVARVIYAFKMLQGFDLSDKGWDRVYFSRYRTPAKTLIQFIGDWHDAVNCVQDIYEKMTGLGLSVMFETILKHSAEWKKDQLEKGRLNGIHDRKSNGA